MTEPDPRLSERQELLLLATCNLEDTTGLPCTVRELQEETECSSKSVALYNLRRLRALGLITFDSRARSTRMTPAGREYLAAYGRRLR